VVLLDISMVPSSALTIAVDDECLKCGGVYLNETICLGCFEFIPDYFSDLGLSPKRSNSGATFMDSTCSRSPSPRWAMIEDSIEEFHMVPKGEGGSSLPSSRRCGVGALFAPATTTP
jgi:hypothetical protein